MQLYGQEKNCIDADFMSAFTQGQKRMRSTIYVQLEQTDNNVIVARWSSSDAADGVLHEGEINELRHWLQAHQPHSTRAIKAVLLISGEQVLCRPLSFSRDEKKHLQKLLPFMLEPQLAVELSRVHVAHRLSTEPAADSNPIVFTACVDKKQLQWRIAELELLGVEVQQSFSLAALLPATDTQWSLLLDADICHLHAGSLLCASVESALLTAVVETLLKTLPATLAAPTLTVYTVAPQHAASAAHDVGNRDELVQGLRELAAVNKVDLTISCSVIAHAFAVMNRKQTDAVDLRQGELAAPLRLHRHWRQWRVPTLAALFAVTAVLVTAIIETQVNQSRFRTLETRMEQRYRQVMPEGVLVDAVQQLSTQLTQQRGAASAQTLTSMLMASMESFANSDDLGLHRLSYNGNTAAANNSAELQLSISAADTSSILQLGESLTAAGWNAQARNINRVGDRQHANLIIRGH